LNGSIDREAPRWSSNLMNLYLQTVDTFSKYENVLAYTVGNEIVRDVPSSASAPFIKAAVRDVKAYMLVTHLLAKCEESLTSNRLSP